jgi:Mg2+ and Co2+ transporter CorA
VIQEITSELEAMDENMTREQFMELVLRHAEDDQHIQALVGVMRPAFDYTFFQTLAEKIDAAQGDERERLVRLRDQVLDLTTLLDQQTQAVLQRAADTLVALLALVPLLGPDPGPLRLGAVLFLAVLQANIQAAEQQQNIELTARLKLVLERVLSILRESAPPQIRFINKVMSAETDEAAQELIAAEGAQFGGELLALMDAIAEDLEASDQPQTAARLRALRGAGAGAVCVFPEANHDPALAADLARDARLRLGAPLDPEGAALPPGPDLYPALLEGLAAAIAACLAP